MINRTTWLLSFAILTGIASSAAAQAPENEPPVLAQVTACRAVADAAARLACYDTAVSAFDAARREGAVMVVDRAQVTEARRQMFGFSVPALPAIFAGESMESLETTLEGAVRLGDGNWQFTLADGSVWRQTDGERMRFTNESGQPVRVRNGALGSFRLTVGNSRAARVRRQ